MGRCGFYQDLNLGPQDGRADTSTERPATFDGFNTSQAVVF